MTFTQINTNEYGHLATRIIYKPLSSGPYDGTVSGGRRGNVRGSEWSIKCLSFWFCGMDVRYALSHLPVNAIRVGFMAARNHAWKMKNQRWLWEVGGRGRLRVNLMLHQFPIGGISAPAVMRHCGRGAQQHHTRQSTSKNGRITFAVSSVRLYWICFCNILFCELFLKLDSKVSHQLSHFYLSWSKHTLNTLTNQPTNSVTQSLSWEANNHSVQQFPAFYGTRRFITVLTTAHYWSLSWARWIQSTLFRPISLRSILISSCHLRLSLPSDLFPSGFPTKILYAFLIYPMPPTYPVHLIVLDLMALVMFSEV
jgi:hypothetical protein